jgi:hypothetical protein
MLRKLGKHRLKLGLQQLEPRDLAVAAVGGEIESLLALAPSIARETAEMRLKIAGAVLTVAAARSKPESD